MNADNSKALYKSLVQRYLDEPDESLLNQASLIGRNLCHRGVSLDNVLAMHQEAIEEPLRGHSNEQEVNLVRRANDPFSELTISYVIAFEELTEIRVADVEWRKHRERLEKLVEERTAELRAANKELESFSYSVSHDLRAPLRSIDGFNQILIEDYEDKLDEEGKDCLQRIGVSIQRMGQMIDDLLNLSRVTRSEMRRETVDLSTLAQTITAELQETQPERRVEFVISEGLVVKGDPRLLHVVLENLLGNAWKFTGKLPQAAIEFGVTQQDGEPAYYVRDDGAGFDMAYVHKLFGAFQRLHRRDEFDGTGVGLASVQRIVQRHGGEVWAEGEVDKGATFYFTL